MAASDGMIGAGPAEKEKKGARRSWWLLAGGVVLLLYVMGTLDVFLARNGLEHFTAHRCYGWPGGELYCDGPWSLNPLPEGAIVMDDAIYY